MTAAVIESPSRPLASPHVPAASNRPVDESTGTGLHLAELMAALSHALDLTEGQPPGHCIRCCFIGMRIADALGLPEAERRSLYFTLLLKDLGCSSNAARICELYLADDLGFKQRFKTVGPDLPSTLGFVFRETGTLAGWGARLKAIAQVLRKGGDMAQELILTRCTRGADIARQLRFDDAVAEGIRGLDEHWDGSGRPGHLSGEAIPLASRVALLAQVVDVFHTGGGPAEAQAEVARRRGTWFDPRLCDVFGSVSAERTFWMLLRAPGEVLEDHVLALEPARVEHPLDDDYLDDIAAAFGSIVDAKSPYTAGHSQRVGRIADGIAQRLGLSEGERRSLRRGALLHDVGKLGVSNAILDKPGKLDADEWAAVRRHAEFTEAILGRIGPMRAMARMAAAHHEKLDGSGYPLGLDASRIAMPTRIITTADIFDAINAQRPYRGATPVDRTLEIMQGQVGTALDPACLDALRALLNEEEV